ncbi:selenoprotein S-like [Microcaecilia unicolor]|uniref:Selenoprotein S n=1 Tax=Microcaecilia unicolor TaxID=1415580 RepID=A0A6P7WWU2_9AMPH|nr:selenoprotein S [Microcaecilia unicolor]XP_030045611.1 selenoprotein S-like [Microcaecilia unicolor]
MELGGEPIPSKPVLETEGITFLQQTVGSALADYGWYIFFGGIATFLVIQRLVGSLRQRQSDAPEASAVDPAMVVKQQEAMAAARLRMQEELDAQAEKYKEKQRLLEEEKRRQKIEMWESLQEGKSYKGTPRKTQELPAQASMSSTARKSEQKPLRRNDYSPLSGNSGGSCSWRPGRRGPALGGG